MAVQICPGGAILGSRMKFCGKCEETKEDDCFSNKRSSKDGLQNWCKVCKRLHENSLYKRSDTYRATKLARNAKVKTQHREFISRYKRFCGCRLCSENEPVCLDLHHIDPNEKDKEVSVLVSSTRLKIKEEMRKCVVLCSNCHRKLHAGLLSI